MFGNKYKRLWFPWRRNNNRSEVFFYYYYFRATNVTFYFLECLRPPVYSEKAPPRLDACTDNVLRKRRKKKKKTLGNLRVSRMGGLVRNNSLNALFWFFVIAGHHENRILWCNLSSSRQVCQLENMDDVGVPNEVTSESELIWTYLLFFFFFFLFFLLLSNKSRKGHRVSLYISK